MLPCTGSRSSLGCTQRAQGRQQRDRKDAFAALRLHHCPMLLLAGFYKPNAPARRLSFAESPIGIHRFTMQSIRPLVAGDVSSLLSSTATRA